MVWACDAKYGNCSDFHSLFTSMARASNIPARFHYGFSLKPDGTTAAHCWAEFKDPEKGWFPVDISEARKVVEKEPAKANYYFGTLSENRVRLSTGRDIVLDPKQAGEPLNFFYAPYVEIDGKSVAPKLDVTHQEKKGERRGRRLLAVRAPRSACARAGVGAADLNKAPAHGNHAPAQRGGASMRKRTLAFGQIGAWKK